MTDINNFQRVGADHNTGVGRSFEKVARAFFQSKEGINLAPNFPVEVGVSDRKKKHRFDLGSADPPVLVECKSHTWTQTGNAPVENYRPFHRVIGDSKNECEEQKRAMVKAGKAAKSDNFIFRIILRPPFASLRANVEPAAERG